MSVVFKALSIKFIGIYFPLVMLMGGICDSSGVKNNTYEDNAYENNTYENDIDEDDLMEILEIDKLQKELYANNLTGNINIKKLINELSKGDFASVKSLVIEEIKNITIGELGVNRKILFELVSIILIGQIFVNLSNSFGKSFVSENGFYVTYLIMTSIMLTSFSITLELVSNAIERVLMLIQIITPVYVVALNFVGHGVTSAGMYEIIMVGICLVQCVILKVILPLIKMYVIVSMVNNLNKEDSFSKMCSLVKNIVEWMLKTIVIFIAGLNVVKGLVDPQIDAIGRDNVNRVISALPGGGVASVLTGTFLGAGLVIKNSVGLIGIILVLLLIMFPVIKTFLIMLVVKITAAMVEPIGEKRYSSGIDSLAKGTMLLLKALISSAVLFVLTMAIMAYVTKG